MKKRRLPLDKVVDKVAALGVPGLVLVVAMASSGFAGAAAITVALAALGGPAGMLGGIALLVMLGLIGRALSDFGLEALFKGVLQRQRAQGLSIEEARKRVDGYSFLSTGLRDKLKRYLDLWGGPPSVAE